MTYPFSTECSEHTVVPVHKRKRKSFVIISIPLKMFGKP